MWRSDLSYPPVFRQPGHRLRSHKKIAIEGHQTMPSYTLPLIDFENLNEPKNANKMAEACREWGFFGLFNHGVPPTLARQVQEEAKKLFSMGFEDKQAQLTHPIKYFFGSPSLQHRVHSLNWLEGFHVPLKQLNDTSVSNHPGLEYFRDLIEEYGKHMNRVAVKIFAALAVNLGLDPVSSVDYLSESDSLVRIYRYPVCPAGNKVLGMDAHTDSSVLSILNQTQVGGLQILKGDHWTDVDPIPDTLVVNLGDMMQAISDDEYKSVKHRVVASQSRERISLCYFGFPVLDAVIRSSNYKEFTYQEFQAQVQEDIKSTGFKVGLNRFKLKSELPPPG